MHFLSKHNIHLINMDWIDVHNCLLAWNMHLTWVFCLLLKLTANSDADVADDMKHVPAEIVPWFMVYKMF